MFFCSPFLSSITLFLISLEIHFNGIYGDKKESETHLENGKHLLSQGKLAEAISYYHQAIEADDTNYLACYGRATIYLGLGKSKSSLPDLDKVLKLKPDFTAARLQRANIYLKQGLLHDAERDYKELVRMNSGRTNEEARQYLESLATIREDREDAEEFMEQENYEAAIEVVTRVIERCPWDPELRELRAKAYIMVGEQFKAISDIKSTTKLVTDNTDGYLKISNLYYDLGEAEDSLTEIRECLKLDPDHPECFKHYKHVKKLHKQMEAVRSAIQESNFELCIDNVEKVFKTAKNRDVYMMKGASQLCHCHSKAGHISDAMDSCTELLEREPNNLNAYCDRAEAHIQNEQYDKAVTDYQQANELDENNHRVQEGMKHAQKLLKQSKKRDYYKILGVKRNARKKEILKAYRKMAAQWHPDRYEGVDKEMAEKKFIDIAAAKEVLTNEEKRSKFDNGEDPLDPEQQAGGGGPFWQQGFNPFGSGGFQFKFHY